jgi:hypothetical protein
MVLCRQSAWPELLILTLGRMMNQRDVRALPLNSTVDFDEVLMGEASFYLWIK